MNSVLSDKTCGMIIKYTKAIAGEHKACIFSEFGCIRKGNRLCIVNEQRL